VSCNCVHLQDSWCITEPNEGGGRLFIFFISTSLEQKHSQFAHNEMSFFASVTHD